MICKNTDLLRTLVKEKKWRNGHMVFCTWLDSSSPQRVDSNMEPKPRIAGLTGVDTKTMPWLALVI
jgi:hypothetical protein